jgi:hypothetical protein
VLIAPGAPRADSGAVGAPRIVGFGAARELVRDLLRRRERAVGGWDLVVHRGIEPRGYRRRRGVDRHRVGCRCGHLGRDQARPADQLGLVRRVGQGKGVVHRETGESGKLETQKAAKRESGHRPRPKSSLRVTL